MKPIKQSIFVVLCLICGISQSYAQSKMDRLIVYGKDFAFGVKKPDGWRGDTGEIAAEHHVNIVFSPLHDLNVWSKEKFTEKLRYIHRNPVHRGLVENPDDWAWSSFRHYATGMEGAVEIESQWTARKREIPACSSRPIAKCGQN